MSKNQKIQAGVEPTAAMAEAAKVVPFQNPSDEAKKPAKPPFVHQQQASVLTEAEQEEKNHQQMQQQPQL